MPFVVYIVIGMTLWMFLSGTILSSITAIQKGKTVLETSKYPLLAVILSSFGQMVFDTSVRIGFVIVVLIFFKISLSWGILLLPIALLPLTLFSLGLGMILAVLNVIIKDVGNMADVVMRYGVFLSSVIFPMPETDLLGRLNLLNPFNTFVVAIRDLIVFGTMAHPGRYLVTSAAAVIIFLVACKIVYFMEYRIKGYL
jgi:lipopolysaccharide transport system permease protein